MENKNQNDFCYWMIPITSVCIVILIVCHCPCLKDKLLEVLTFIVALVSAIVAYKQYDDYKKREKYGRLSRLNERYATDTNITRVVQSILHCYNDDRNYFDVNQFNNTPCANETHKREMFLRFFEELSYAIETGSLNEDKVCYFFSYYAIVANLMKDKFFKDYNDKSWERFREFAEKMQNTAKTKGYFKFNVDETNNTISPQDAERPEHEE